VQKLTRLLVAAGVALALLAAFAVSTLRADTPAGTGVLTGRTHDGSPFVTQLVNGHITWFDTTLQASCDGSTWTWNWHADLGTQQFRWTGTRLTAHHTDVHEDTSYSLDLEADYTPQRGLSGRARLIMDGCDSGWISFWATADR
jgi:hypothetical protein